MPILYRVGGQKKRKKRHAKASKEKTSKCVYTHHELVEQVRRRVAHRGPVRRERGDDLGERRRRAEQRGRAAVRQLGERLNARDDTHARATVRSSERL